MKKVCNPLSRCVDRDDVMKDAGQRLECLCAFWFAVSGEGFY